MSAPNLLTSSTVLGKTAGLAVSTVLQSIVGNPSASGKVLKINSLYIANINSGSANVTVDILKNNTTSYKLAYQVVVQSGYTLTPISKDVTIYLEENDSLRLSAGTNGYFEAICSYEDIS